MSEMADHITIGNEIHQAIMVRAKNGGGRYCADVFISNGPYSIHPAGGRRAGKLLRDMANCYMGRYDQRVTAVELAEDVEHIMSERGGYWPQG